MHVALNLVFLVPGETGGTETYARELIPRLAASRDLRITALINREAAAAPGAPWLDVPHEVVPVSARHRLEWARGEQQHVPALARRLGCDLVHSLANTAPLWGWVPRVTTVHDLHHRLVPDAHFGPNALGMRVLVGGAVRRSRRVLVDAESTRDDLVRLLGANPESIDVVPLGVSPAAAVQPTSADALRGDLALGDRPVLLTVSAKRPHKNLMRLLEAHARLGGAGTARPVLVLPGYPTPHEAQLRERADELGTRDDVRFVGWISPADLEGLYAMATAFVFPSLYEGFGLPVLEAMARGVPVACSGRGSLAEVAGDAALLFDPEDVGTITEALGRLLGVSAGTRRLREAGLERAARFTWERTAELTIAGYGRALSAGRR